MKQLKNRVCAGLIAMMVMLAMPVTAESPMQIDVADAVEVLADGLASGQRSTARLLTGLGNEALTDAVERLQSIDGFRYPGFSAKALIEELYFLAEQANAGGGNRFLAFLYEPLAVKSVAFATDPVMIEIRSQASDEPLRFADPTTIGERVSRPALSSSVRHAIELVAETAAGPTQFHGAMSVATRSLNLRQPPSPNERVFEAVARSRTAVEALTALVASHAPPPILEAAMQRFLVDVAADSAALSVEPRLSAILRELAEAPIPPDLARMVTAEPNLPSRQLQAQRLPVSARARGSDEDRLASVTKAGGVEDVASAVSSAGVGGGSGLRSDYDRYVRSTMAPRVATLGRVFRPSGQTTRLGGGMLPGEPSPSGLGGTPRDFGTARYSPNAGRGISVGAAISWPDVVIEAAAWVQSAVDVNFGRFVVVTAEGVFASEPLFGDSAAAAVSTIWGEHGLEAEFREGEILILMSMDPARQTGSRDYQTPWERFDRSVATALIGLGQNEQNYILALLANDEQRAVLLQQRRGFNRVAVERALSMIASEFMRLPYNRIVVHPAAHGLELAWAAGRVDFWPSRVDELLREVRRLSAPDTEFVERLREFPGAAETWQFYERGGELIATIGEPWGSLRMRSEHATGAVSARNRFSITLFATKGRPQGQQTVQTEVEGTWRLSQASANADALLDDLFVRHPDFVRVNHFSEAFSIVRWVAAQRVPLAIYDSLGTERNIPSPRWILQDRTLAVEIPSGPRR